MLDASRPMIDFGFRATHTGQSKPRHENIHQLLLRVTLVHLPKHHRQKLGEIDLSVAVGVNLSNHCFQLRVCGFLPQTLHHVSELLCGDGAAAVLVEDGERVLELLHLSAGKIRPVDSLSCVVMNG